jgi:thioredoxin 2
MEGQDLTSAKIRCPNCGKMNRVPATAAGTPRCGNCHRPMPWVIDADDGSFSQVVEQASIPVVVDFWAPWCQPCRMVSPALERVATDLAGRIKLVKVNVDIAPALQRRFEVRSIPTLLIFKDGQVIASQLGAASAPAIRTWVDQALRPA